jgi:hypothetical protein
VSAGCIDHEFDSMPDVRQSRRADGTVLLRGFANPSKTN